MEKLAWSTGAGTTLANVQDKSTSGGQELALVYPRAPETKNSGKAFSTTPGHFELSICSGD